MACTTPPAERLDLVHRLGEALTVGEQTVFLSTQDRTDAEGEDGWQHLALFDAAATRWVYDALGVRVTRRVAMAYGQNTVAVQYTVQNGADGPCTLAVTPWLRFVPKGGRLTRRRRFAWGGGVIESGGVRLYYAVEHGPRRSPGPCALNANITATTRPTAAPPTGLAAAAGRFVFTAAPGQTQTFAVVFGLESAAAQGARGAGRAGPPPQSAGRGRRAQKARWGRRLSAAADAFLVQRQSTGGMTILAGYPFFGDWGRDTMIALPGLALSTGRYADAKSILRTFAAHEQDGLMPNLFPQDGAPPQYNTVDAALLFLHCLWLYHRRTGDAAFVREVWPVAQRIVQRYCAGTHHGIPPGRRRPAVRRAGAGPGDLDGCAHRHPPAHAAPRQTGGGQRLLVQRPVPDGRPGPAGRGRRRPLCRAGRTGGRKFPAARSGCRRNAACATSSAPCPAPADTQLRPNQIFAAAMPTRR